MCKVALWSQGWYPACKPWGFLLGVKWLWNHLSHIIKNSQFSQETEIGPGSMLWKGKVENKETPCPLYSTQKEHSPQFFLLYLSTKFSLLKIQWDPVRSALVVSHGCFYAGYKSLTSLKTLECVDMRMHEATLLLAKL